MWNVAFKAVTGVKIEKKKKQDKCKIWMRIRLVWQSIIQTVTGISDGNFGLSKNRISTI
jgi:hypothetical protein